MTVSLDYWQFIATFVIDSNVIKSIDC